jgi:environmental stress-induced protein Ves
MPWKNGAGETVEIAISPIGAGINDFDWRVSMARVDADGPFSAFAGVDRTLAILVGKGLALSIDGSAPVILTTESRPLSFPGDVPTSAVPIKGQVTDLNVMTRRGRFQHRMERFDIAGSVDAIVDARVALLVCSTGSVRVEAQGREARLAPLDAVQLDRATQHVTIVAESGDARCYLIRLEHC